MKKLFKYASIFSFFALFPIISFAQDFVGPCPSGTHYTTTGCVSDSGVVGLITKIQGILNGIVPLLVTLGVVFLIWGIVQYVIGDGEEAKKKGKDRIIYGIIGLAVIIGLWGLVNIVTNTFGIGGAAPTNGQLQNLLPK
jgi:mannose/fructose/N-acetylgalactosamine-specific phosphotransferase system component IID